MTINLVLVVAIVCVIINATILIYFINKKDPNTKISSIKSICKKKDEYKEVKFPKRKEILTATGLKIQFGKKYFHITKGGNYMSEITIDNILLDSLRKDIPSDD